MFTIIQQGVDDSMFYTLQVNGTDIEHFTSLEAAARSLESIKYELEEAYLDEQFSSRKDS